MHPTDRLNLLDVLDELLQLPRERRQERIDQLGLSDADSTTLRTWLKYHDSSDGFLESIPRECMRFLFGEVESPADGSSGTERSGFDDFHPPQVSGYEVKDLLGQGGMAVVWRARQAGTGREVALKVLNPLLFCSARARGRFEREVRVTARLHHPHIAEVYDGGADSNLCFYAMELVEGEPLDRFVRSHNLTRRQTLELMCKVCEAVKHAHQNGVIHRDLKPSNILVDRAGEPRVLDFGLAKALAEVGPEITVSHEGDLAGTPAYMSPEQASASGSVDTRSDVYSLGVILYRLLTGQPPHDLSGSRFQVLQRISGEEVRSPRAFDKRIDRDLEALLLKALSREPQQRYATAAELAEDLSRYLRGEPLIAHLPTLRYLLAKRLRRHWLGATIAAAVFAILLGTAIFSYVRIAQERTKALASAERADEQAAISKAVNDFLNKDVLGQAAPMNQLDPRTAPDRNLTVRAALDRAADRIGGTFQNKPLIEVAIRCTIGEAYLELAEYEKAEQHATVAAELSRRAVGEGRPETIRSMLLLADCHSSQGRYRDAEALYLQTFDVARAALGPEHLETLKAMRRLASFYIVERPDEKAEPLLLELLQLQRRVLGPQAIETISTMNGLAAYYMNQAEWSKAEPYAIETLASSRKSVGEDHPRTLTALHNLGLLYHDEGLDQKATPLLEENLSRSRVVFGDLHPHTIEAMNCVAIVSLGERGEALYREALARARKVGDDPTERQLTNLASRLLAQGTLDESEALLREAVEINRRIRPPGHPETAWSLDRYAGVLKRKGKRIEAEQFIREALEIRRAALPAEHPHVTASVNNLAVFLREERRLTEAEPLFREALSIKKRIFPAGHPEIAHSLREMGLLLQDQGKFDEAEPLLRESLEIRRKALPAGNDFTLMSMWNLAVLLKQQRKFAEAEQLLREAIDLFRPGMARGVPDKETIVCELAWVLEPQAKFEEALPLLYEAFEMLNSMGPEKYQQKREVIDALADFCAATNRPDEAAKWRAELAALEASTQPGTQPAFGELSRAASQPTTQSQ